MGSLVVETNNINNSYVGIISTKRVNAVIRRRYIYYTGGLYLQQGRYSYLTEGLIPSLPTLFL